MKTKLLVALATMSALFLAAGTGCVQTVTGQKTAGMPFVKDTFENRYRKSPEVLFNAAVAVVKEDGVLLTEGTVFEQGNPVKVVTGRVNQCNVWIRVAPLDPQVTSVSVQARTTGGGGNVDLIQQLATEIAVKASQ